MTLSAAAVSMDVLTPAPALAVRGGATRARIGQAAQDFEGQFLSIMVGQMFDGVEAGAPFGGGEGEAAFKSFLTDAIGKSMARHGGVGLTRSLTREMLKMQGLAPEPGSQPVQGPAGAAAAYGQKARR